MPATRKARAAAAETRLWGEMAALYGEDTAAAMLAVLPEQQAGARTARPLPQLPVCALQDGRERRSGRGRIVSTGARGGGRKSPGRRRETQLSVGTHAASIWEERGTAQDCFDPPPPVDAANRPPGSGTRPARTFTRRTECARLLGEQGSAQSSHEGGRTRPIGAARAAPSARPQPTAAAHMEPPQSPLPITAESVAALVLDIVARHEREKEARSHAEDRASRRSRSPHRSSSPRSHSPVCFTGHQTHPHVHQGRRPPVAEYVLEESRPCSQRSLSPMAVHQESSELTAEPCRYTPDMKQKNVLFETERDVRRRPKFLNIDDVKLLRGSTRSAAAKSPLKLGTSPLNLGTPPLKSGTSPMNNDFYPKSWDPEAMPEIGCKKVLVSDFSEFLKIGISFSKTVRGHKVKKIWRLQNPSLWQVFQWQKEQMKKVNQGRDVKEMQLFHGTDSAHIDDICDHNFDWRICGTHGTVLGQGSYFARDASYSHNYSTPTSSGIRAMFVARVLVGDYVTGNLRMKRPPLRPGSSSQYYDSCVDNTTDPSIFVVFEKHQIYPEYLLEYEEEQKNY